MPNTLVKNEFVQTLGLDGYDRNNKMNKFNLIYDIVIVRTVLT